MPSRDEQKTNKVPTACARRLHRLLSQPRRRVIDYSRYSAEKLFKQLHQSADPRILDALCARGAKFGDDEATYYVALIYKQGFHSNVFRLRANPTFAEDILIKAVKETNAPLSACLLLQYDTDDMTALEAAVKVIQGIASSTRTISSPKLCLSAGKQLEVGFSKDDRLLLGANKPAAAALFYRGATQVGEFSISCACAYIKLALTMTDVNESELRHCIAIISNTNKPPEGSTDKLEYSEILEIITNIHTKNTRREPLSKTETTIVNASPKIGKQLKRGEASTGEASRSRSVAMPPPRAQDDLRQPLLAGDGSNAGTEMQSLNDERPSSLLSS